MNCLPFLLSWNTTKRCNLKCAHCYLDSAELEGPDEVGTVESKRFVDEISELCPGAMLILTGGEPLLRPDFFDIASYAARVKGLAVVVGTNGTLVDEKVAWKLKECGVRGVGVSLDSGTPSYHDLFRGVAGSWEMAVHALEALGKCGLDFQVQFSITRENKEELPDVIELAVNKGARAVNVFFLVCTGRGENLTDLGSDEYEETLLYLAEVQEGLGEKIMVRARCAPHYTRVTAGVGRGEPVPFTSGCIAGRGYLRISPEGFVTPCPYMQPNPGSLNLRETRLGDIIERDPAFALLQKAEYQGRCGRCEFKDACGGCRARALVASGKILGEDPFCSYEPPKTPVKRNVKPQWTEEALLSMEKVPAFVRALVKRGVESYAEAKGIREITPGLLQEMKRLRGKEPSN